MLQNPELSRTIVFSKTKHGANRIALELEHADIKVSVLHGNKSQTARQQALEDFKKGRSRVLIATDIAARGIDVRDVSHVINYDLPNEPESYVHRIGRTARAGAEGVAYSFCDETEKKLLRDIEKVIRFKITVAETMVLGTFTPSPRAKTQQSEHRRESRPFGKPTGRPSRPAGRPGESRGEGRSFSKPAGERSEDRSFDKPTESRGEGRSFSKPAGQRSEGRSFSKPAGERREGRSFGKPAGERGEGRSFSKPAGERSEGRPFGKPSESRGEGRSFSKPAGERSEGRSFSKPAGQRSEDRPFKPAGQRSEGRPFGKPTSEQGRKSFSSNAPRKSGQFSGRSNSQKRG